MPYKSIMTYIEDQPDTQPWLKTAVEIARQYSAHLTIAVHSRTADQPPFIYGDASGMAVAEFIEESKQATEALVAAARETLLAEDILGEVCPVAYPYGAPGHEFGRLAQFADLIVLGGMYDAEAGKTLADVFSGALFGSDATMLAVPPGTRTLRADNMLIAWNDSREALRAVRRAVPLLGKAGTVTILMIDPSTRADDMPGAELATMLDRYGIKAEISTVPRGNQLVGDLIAQRAQEAGADLVVMGGYGHSRFQEYVLGGATRDFLKQLPVPVLMAH